MPRTSLTERLVKPAVVLSADDSVVSGVRKLLGSGLPALPVVDTRGSLIGIFGEREFLRALFPRYVSELHSAAFMPAAFDENIEQRTAALQEPILNFITTDRVAVAPTASDVQVAETFLHHRVLVLPVVANGAVVGVVTRRDFFAALAEEFLARAAEPGAALPPVRSTTTPTRSPFRFRRRTRERAAESEGSERREQPESDDED